MSLCGKCLKTINRSTKDKVQCAECTSYFHLVCANLTETEVGFYQKSGGFFTCNKCMRGKRLSRSGSDSGVIISPPGKQNRSIIVDVHDENNLGAGTIRGMLKEMLTETENRILQGQRQLEVELGKSIEYCHVKLIENEDTLKKQQDIIDKQNKIIESLKGENILLYKRINDLAVQIDDCQQYARSNTLEIFGVPEVGNENTVAKVIDVGKALGVNICEDMIDACHRLQNTNTRRGSAIIVKFVRRSVKEELLQKRRVKRNLNTKDIGLGGDSVIYINQSLTPMRKFLFGKAKQLNYKFRWIDRTGKVKVRMEEGSKVFVISIEDDINRLLKNSTEQSTSNKKN